MSAFREVGRVPGATPLKGYNDKTYSWKKLLQACFKKKFKDEKFVHIDALKPSLIKEFDGLMRVDACFEIKVEEYTGNNSRIEVRWFAKIVKVCGYRILARYLGYSDDETEHDFWVNMISSDVKPCGNVIEIDPDLKNHIYAPPPALAEKHNDDMIQFVNNTMEEGDCKRALMPSFERRQLGIYDSKFKVGQRLELLDYNDARQVRVARIKHICGRRVNVLVTKDDFDGTWVDKFDDRQLDNKGAEFWIDQESFFIFPVGWAAYNGYKMEAKQSYKDHAKSIADRLKKNKSPSYKEIDATPEMFSKPDINVNLLEKVKVGQRIELIDPLTQQFQELKVASVLKILKTPGYVMIGIDGPDAEEDSVPLHLTSPFIFPVGYAAKHGLKLVPPQFYEIKKFTWPRYLKEMEAEALPVELFRPNPGQRRLEMFTVGAHLEAADMCENQFICPATIKSIHGRVINVNFDGWDAEFDELYDIDSHDILPVGWCEINGYILQEPKK